MRIVKEKYYINQFHNCDSKSTWKSINLILGRASNS